MTRAWLVVICLLLLALALLGMWRGWRNRAARQSDLADLPAVPSDLGAATLATLAGLYVGTTFASSWQDRVVHRGLGRRASATATLYPSGVRIDRVGAGPIFLPAAAIVGARLAPGLAGQVVGAGGLLVITWRLGDAELDTGLRADDKAAYPDWVRAINALRDRSSDVSQHRVTQDLPSPGAGIRHWTGRGAAG
ncbi:MAG: transporter [Jatrophihabitantaceae bacterium]